MRVRMACVMVVTAGIVAPVAGGAQSTDQSKPAGVLQAELKAQLGRGLDRIAATLDGIVGYSVTDLTTHERVASRLEHEAMPTASAIKLAVLYELMTQAEAGTLALDMPMPLRREQIAAGSGVVQFLTTPSLSLRDHATLMVAVSDNTSTNIVIEAAGMDRINARMRALGLGDIRLRRLMMDAAAVKRGDENVASPRSLARIAELLWRGDGLRPESRDAAIGMLRLVSGAMRAAVPGRVPVFAKTGGLPGVRTEAGVVAVEGRPFSIAVMTTYLQDDAEGGRVIREMTAAAYSYFARRATGGAYGRQ